ncbi:uncharacterized protein LOC107619130 isoform X1 [Arachis ipaensis]|uniref:uncharacterized protein LOC107619130 isoform X1 n=1 Tax=Arachis ipaensis TaxID=130454 RepID=UPI000A2B1C2F|nr:uncharacterized protein LOC107619130 isoform X1 [Arachis ipaensis]
MSLTHFHLVSPHSLHLLHTPSAPSLLPFKAAAPIFLSHNPSLSSTLSRRLFLLPSVSVSVSGIWDAITGAGNNNPRDAVLAIRRGMSLFRQGDVSGSLVEFDRAIELDPRQKAYLWQRGLSLYYLDRFEEGAEQFRLDVAQNPNDTEESIWCFLCEAQLYGVDEARKRYLEVGRDPRPVMREAYNMFKDGGDPEKLVAAFSSGRTNEFFYASLYAGLYYESQIHLASLSYVALGYVFNKQKLFYIKIGFGTYWLWLGLSFLFKLVQN